jgi:peptidoglycan/xylan/chitin deacetylase (PgdA/CDA1 family)
MRLKERIIRWGMAAVVRSGADRRLAGRARGMGVILMLHHVRPWEPREFAPNRLLEVTPEFLDTALTVAYEEGFEPVTLEEAVWRTSEGDGDAPFMAVTFDDGYRDNVDYALPILRRHGVPWTMFVTTGFATRTASLWWLELEEAIRALDRVDVGLGEDQLRLVTDTDAAKAAAFEAIYWRLRKGPEDRLRSAVAELAEEAGVDGRALVQTLCLDWEGIRRVANEPDVSIGAHTLTHPMLAKQNDVFAAHEMAESKAIIERVIGRPVDHLAYPVGDQLAAGPREFQMAAEAGYTAAVTTRPGHVFPAHADHLTALPRVSVNGLYQTAEAFRALLSGVPFLIWNRGRQLNVG